jgi:hypothetical protein
MVRIDLKSIRSAKYPQAPAIKVPPAAKAHYFNFFPVEADRRRKMPLRRRRSGNQNR